MTKALHYAGLFHFAQDLSPGCDIVMRMHTRRSEQIERALWIVVLLVLSCFVAQAFGPLQLELDSPEFLSLGISLAHGHGLRFQGVSSHYPPGYPAIVAALIKLHLANAFALVGVNLLALVAALRAIYKLAKEHLGLAGLASVAVLALTVLSREAERLTLFPMSDIVYLGLSAYALLQMARARAEHRHLLLALTATAAAISVRTIGIALLPSLALAMWQATVKRPIALHARQWWIISVAALLISAGAAVLLLRSMYFREALDVYRRGLPHGLLSLAQYWTADLGCILLNVRAARVGIWACFAGAAAALPLISACTRHICSPAALYVLSYLLLLLAWPYQETRLLLPLLPFIFLIAAREVFSDGVIQHRRRLEARVVIAYASVFAALGVVALVISTRISFSGSAFSRNYFGGEFQGTYEQYLYGHTTQRVDPDALKSLRCFGSHRLHDSVCE